MSQFAFFVVVIVKTRNFGTSPKNIFFDPTKKKKKNYPPTLGIGATIPIGQRIQCVPYADFLFKFLNFYQFEQFFLISLNPKTLKFTELPRPGLEVMPTQVSQVSLKHSAKEKLSNLRFICNSKMSSNFFSEGAITSLCCPLSLKTSMFNVLYCLKFVKDNKTQETWV